MFTKIALRVINSEFTAKNARWLGHLIARNRKRLGIDIDNEWHVWVTEAAMEAKYKRYQDFLKWCRWVKEHG